jgi:hypothetical protein
LSIRSVFVKYNVSYHQYCGKSATWNFAAVELSIVTKKCWTHNATVY